MDVRGIAALALALIVGVGVGVVLPEAGGEGEVREPAASELPTKAPSPSPQAVAGLPEACAEALRLAEDAVRFGPEALARLRSAYEQAMQAEEGGGQSGPPPAAVFAQLQSQAEAMASRFAAAHAACQGAHAP